ncbi:hypothetical protein MKW98_010021 [Papaver atlanticum]|uniref:Uncharacterized protein n=1 Tax=Papaver atlanticum TaxID=357466 RepID=A0AAD4X589_9MAGN|nr:hypothetical protein MKW98_010021 [Papaver atlanticum]
MVSTINSGDEVVFWILREPTGGGEGGVRQDFSRARKRRKKLWMKFLLKQYQEGRARILKATLSPYIAYYPVVKNRLNRLQIRWYREKADSPRNTGKSTISLEPSY